MSLLSTFSTNCINILTWINGLEDSQAIIITISVIINNLLYLPWPIDWRIPLHLLGNQTEVSSKLRVDGGGVQVWHIKAGCSWRDIYLAFYFLMLLLGHNWYGLINLWLCSSRLTLCRVWRYPARTFLGDIFCYLTGMAFSVGIQAHFSKTLPLCFLLQHHLCGPHQPSHSSHSLDYPT